MIEQEETNSKDGSQKESSRAREDLKSCRVNSSTIWLVLCLISIHSSTEKVVDTRELRGCSSCRGI